MWLKNSCADGDDDLRNTEFITTFSCTFSTSMLFQLRMLFPVYSTAVSDGWNDHGQKVLEEGHSPGKD